MWEESIQKYIHKLIPLYLSYIYNSIIRLIHEPCVSHSLQLLRNQINSFSKSDTHDIIYF